MAGRPRKHPEILKLQGTFRADRHAEVESVPLPPGSVIEPLNLDKEGLIQWRLIRDSIVPLGILSAADQCIVDICCRTWSLLQDAIAAAQLEPTNAAARTAVTTYNHDWMICAAKIGLSPVDRVKLGTPRKVETTEKKDDFYGEQTG